MQVHISERRNKRERLRQLVDLAKQAKLDDEVDFLQKMLKSVMSSLLNDVTAMKEDQEREADLKVESWPLLFSLLFSTLFRCTSTAASRSDTSSVAFRCAFLFRNKQKRIADAAKTRREIRALEQRINKTKVDIAEFQAADTFMLEQEVVAERKQDLIKIQRVSSALPACLQGKLLLFFWRVEQCSAASTTTTATKHDGTRWTGG